MNYDRVIAIFNLNSTEDTKQVGQSTDNSQLVAAILALACAVGEVAEAVYAVKRDDHHVYE